MSRIDALSISAKMIKDKSFWDSLNEPSKAHPVSLKRLGFVAHLAVAVMGYICSPLPTWDSIVEVCRAYNYSGKEIGESLLIQRDRDRFAFSHPEGSFQRWLGFLRLAKAQGTQLFYHIASLNPEALLN